MSESRAAALPRARRRRIRPPSKWAIFAAGWVVYGLAVLSKCVWLIAEGQADWGVVVLGFLTIPGLVMWHEAIRRYRSGMPMLDPPWWVWLVDIAIWLWGAGWVIYR